MNQEKIMLFHFLGDETKPHGQELRQLTDAIKGLKQQNPKLRALLVGGQSFWPFSSELGEGIKRLFEKERIPFSVFWGHNDEMGQSHIAYDARRDTWYVSTLGDDRYTPYNAFEVLDLPQLKGAFEEIALDSGDVVVLGNQTYRSAEVNQSRRKPF